MVIVAAVDQSNQANVVLEEADALAERFDDRVHVLHVMKRSEAIHGEETEGDHELERSDLQGRAKEVSSKLIEKHDFTVEAEAIGRIGDPGGKIVEYTESQNARYVVVSPQKRSQTGKVLFGSVAQSVILNAHCPVVSLRITP